jgi:large subunit ribosomal protein L31
MERLKFSQSRDRFFKRLQLCQDVWNGFQFVTRSTLQTKETIELDGKTMPLVKLETTSESHPFYTGTQKSIDNLGGRVEKFRNKFRVGIKK